MKAPPPPRGLGGNSERKNTPCISNLAGVKFLLKKERVFFFRGSALQVFWQCGGAKCGRGKAKTIFAGGKGFCFVSALFQNGGGLMSAAQEGAGGMRGGFALCFAGFIKEKIRIYCYESKVKK